MTTAAAVLAKARSQIGYTESPPGSNRTKYGAAFGMNGEPWCAMFAWWVAHEVAGNDNLVPEIAWTPGLARWYQEQNRWGTSPRVGALAFFDFPDREDRIQHVGFVEAILNDGRIQTIEGNTKPEGGTGLDWNGGVVARRHREPAGIVVLYGYPRYSDPAPHPSAGYTLHRALHAGLQGDDVAHLQRRIGCKDDGDFGPVTGAHLGAFQHRHGLVVDEVCGPKTAKALGWHFA